MHRFIKSLGKLLTDGGLAAAAFWLAFNLRYEFEIPPENAQLLIFAIPHALGAMALARFFGQNKTLWRYTSVREMSTLGLVVLLNTAATGILVFMLTRMEGFPRSVPIILLLVQTVLFVGPRVLVRAIYDFWQKEKPVKKENILLVGASDIAEAFLRSPQARRRYTIHGILDESAEKIGRSLHGVSVLGRPSLLGSVLNRVEEKGEKISLIILTHPTPMTESFIACARKRGISLRQINSPHDMSEDNLAKLKPVLVEDLLGRPARMLDSTPVKNMLQGKNVLVTGAGGSIGSELCRQILSHKPHTLTLVENNEFALFEIEKELQALAGETKLVPVLADVRHKDEITHLFKKTKPNVLYHAAAYKHVPLVEANPIGGMVTNLFGTMNVADAAVAAKIPNMVVISSDKAVNPTNVMGATKRAAEVYCQNHPSAKGVTHFTTVRFGNVLGSSGSVIPHFARQIEQGGPVTVTSKQAERYFMTIPEAVQLVLHAGTIGASDAEQAGDVLMLNMGEPVKIWHLAEEMVRLSGLTPHADIEIKEIGMRPGEKIKEELWYKEEVMQPTELEDVFRVSPQKIAKGELQKKIKEISTRCESQDAHKAVKALRNLVPEYSPADTSPYA